MSAGPLVTFIDPLTWTREFSYAVEERLLTDVGARLVVPRDEQERDELLPHADAVVSSGTVNVGADTIERLKNCVAIQCYSVGMNAIDLAAAAKAGIRVGNANASTTEVADHTMALLLALQRRLVAMISATSRGEWDLRKLPIAREIRRLGGQTLGIVGAGRIGQAVAARAQAFGFVTIASDPVHPDPPDLQLQIVSLEDLFARSDAIALCASLGPNSYKLINGDVLAHTKHGALFVNTARGALVDEPALASALADGRIALAALDVRDPEPPDPRNDPLGGRPDVIQTPHMAAMSDGSREDIHRLVAESLISMLRESGRLADRSTTP